MPLNPMPTINDHTIRGNIRALNLCRTNLPPPESALKNRPLNMANSGMWNAKIKPLVVLRLGKFDCMMCPHTTRKMANAFKKSIQRIRLTMRGKLTDWVRCTMRPIWGAPIFCALSGWKGLAGHTPYSFSPKKGSRPYPTIGVFGNKLLFVLIFWNDSRHLSFST